MILALVGAVACRPEADSAPLQPSTPTPAPPDPSVSHGPGVSPDAPAKPAASSDSAPSAEALCEAFAARYCEPGDESPAAIRPELRAFVVLDCKKTMLECPDAKSAVHSCIDSTKACGDMQTCLPKSPDCTVGK
jgi:hypothetical protein